MVMEMILLLICMIAFTVLTFFIDLLCEYLEYNSYCSNFFVFFVRLSWFGFAILCYYKTVKYVQ